MATKKTNFHGKSGLIQSKKKKKKKKKKEKKKAQDERTSEKARDH